MGNLRPYLAAAAGYNDEADALYVGVAEVDLTIRAEKSKSAQKLQELAQGETVYVIDAIGELALREDFSEGRSIAALFITREWLRHGGK